MEGSKPVQVDVDATVLTIRAIRETDLMYTLDLFLTMYWTDSRINGRNTTSENGTILDNTYASKLWIPAINFKNSVEVRTVEGNKPLSYFSVYNVSKVRFSQRISLDLLCDMDFSSYP